MSDSSDWSVDIDNGWGRGGGVVCALFVLVLVLAC